MWKIRGCPVLFVGPRLSREQQAINIAQKPQTNCLSTDICQSLLTNLFMVQFFESKIAREMPNSARKSHLIGHFRVPLCLCFKASLSAKPFS